MRKTSVNGITLIQVIAVILSASIFLILLGVMIPKIIQMMGGKSSRMQWVVNYEGKTEIFKYCYEGTYCLRCTDSDNSTKIICGNFSYKKMES